MDDLGDGRVSVPLHMFEGNMEALLNNRLSVEAISLRRDYSVAGMAVILVVHDADKEAAAEIGFKTAPFAEGVW